MQKQSTLKTSIVLAGALLLSTPSFANGGKYGSIMGAVKQADEGVRAAIQSADQVAKSRTELAKKMSKLPFAKKALEPNSSDDIDWGGVFQSINNHLSARIRNEVRHKGVTQYVYHENTKEQAKAVKYVRFLIANAKSFQPAGLSNPIDKFLLDVEKARVLISEVALAPTVQRITSMSRVRVLDRLSSAEKDSIISRAAYWLRGNPGEDEVAKSVGLIFKNDYARLDRLMQQFFPRIDSQGAAERANALVGRIMKWSSQSIHNQGIPNSFNQYTEAISFFTRAARYSTGYVSRQAVDHLTTLLAKVRDQGNLEKVITSLDGLPDDEARIITSVLKEHIL